MALLSRSLLISGCLGHVRLVLPAAITGGFAGSLLQWGYNELRVLQIKSLSQDKSQISTTSQISWRDRALSWIGVTKMSEEQYLEVLYDKRAKLRVQIDEMQQKLDDENSKGKQEDV
jgi:hypothetical protein